MTRTVTVTFNGTMSLPETAGSLRQELTDAFTQAGLTVQDFAVTSQGLADNLLHLDLISWPFAATLKVVNTDANAADVAGTIAGIVEHISGAPATDVTGIASDVYPVATPAAPGAHWYDFLTAPIAALHADAQGLVIVVAILLVIAVVVVGPTLAKRLT